jgi:cell division septation protein DedD
MNVSSRKPLLAKEKTMTTFTIDAENNITAYPNATDATECNPDLAQFDSEGALAKLSADWPMSRFVEIWNSIPGNTEVSKLADRKKAVARIWKAILPLASDGQTSKAEAKPKKEAKGATSATKAKAAKKPAPAKKAAHKPKSDRTNKKAEVIAMMQRAKGATLDEIVKATGWQRHTVRGFVSILGSKGGEKIESSKNASGERTYKIAK